MLCPDEDDEIMAEVRRIRDEYAAEFGYDYHKMWEARMRRQAEFPHEYVCYDKDNPHYVGDNFRYEDFFARPELKWNNVPPAPPDGEE